MKVIVEQLKLVLVPKGRNIQSESSLSMQVVVVFCEIDPNKS